MRWTAWKWQMLSLSHITTITGARVNASASMAQQVEELALQRLPRWDSKLLEVTS
jgi:hypothetical protein